MGRAITFLLWLAISAHAAGPVRSPEKLRSLALLPAIPLQLGIYVESGGTIRLGLIPTNHLPNEIAKLRRELQGDASDAERYLLIGKHLVSLGLGKETEAKQAFLKSTELFRVRAEARPHDGPLQAKYAEMLWQYSENPDGAERVLRAATKTVPEDWACWAELGDLLRSTGLEVVIRFGAQMRTNELAGKATSESDVSQMIEFVTGRATEADKCFDRAVAAAPKRPEPYVRRGAHRFQLKMLESTGKLALSRTAGDEKKNLASWTKDISTSEVCSDWATAARLAPTNTGVVAFWAWLEAMSAAQEGGGNKLFYALPESRRKNVLEAVRMLEDLTEGSNATLAASAWELLGLLRIMVMNEPTQAKTAFRRAVTLDSSRSEAWEGLFATATMESDPKGIVAISEERLKHDDNSRNRVIAAKACDMAKMDEKAIAHARAAVKLDGDSPLARITLGALLLRRTKDPMKDVELMEQHNRMAKIMDKLGEEPDLFYTETLNVYILGALSGEIDSARKRLHEFEQRTEPNKDYIERAREILTVLGD